MTNAPAPSETAAKLLLVTGGDLDVIRGLLAAVGATVDVLGDVPAPVQPAPDDTGRRLPDSPRSAGRLMVGPLVVDPAAHECWLGGRKVPCTATEFALLVCLAERPGQVFTRRQLLERLRASAEYVTERTVDTHVNNLRRKLGDDAASPELIETVYAVGYKLRPVPRRLEAVSSPNTSADSA